MENTSVPLLALALLVPARSGGSIVGVVTTRAVAPNPIRVTIDPDVCGSAVPDDSIVVDTAGHLSGVVLTVTGLKTMAPAEVAVVNERCRFTPRVALVRPKGIVKMTSRDSVLHTMHAAGADGKALFNLSMPIQNLTMSRPIDRPGVVTLSCSTHTWMRGFLFVTDEASAISAADGSFRLDNVPAGMREVRVWHETLQSTPLRVTVRDGETTTVDVVLEAAATPARKP